MTFWETTLAVTLGIMLAEIVTLIVYGVFVLLSELID